MRREVFVDYQECEEKLTQPQDSQQEITTEDLTPDKKQPQYKELKVALTNGFYEVYFTGGGQVPSELRGRFTSPKDADMAIRVLLDQIGGSNKSRHKRHYTYKGIEEGIVYG